MNKLKIDERIENAMNAFFENEPDTGHFTMTYTGNETALLNAEISFAEKADRWSGILREITMFGPGTFSLFYLTLTIAFFYPTLGFSFQGGLMYLFAVFLTYAGSGNINKLKNLAVPGTVIAMALGVVFFALLFPGGELADIYFWYSIYLFPIVLIAAKLVQAWVSDE
jgi:hypothetical protein